MMTPLLTVRGLSKRFGGLNANEDVSFEVGRGEIVGLIGPNGAGKTTLFNCIAGFYAPSAGSIEFSGAHARKRRATRHRTDISDRPHVRLDDRM
jgi:ABC-type branched-subunit amino acid transport system ATPase component